MYTFGIDIGSTTSKCVVMKDGETIVSSSLFVGGIGTPGPQKARETALLEAGLTEADMAAVTATGYGRNRCENVDFNVSELSCHALGAHTVFPNVRTIIDIGGQDAKVIALNADGKMVNFLMNDKCAAGTGRFLDVMANILLVPVESMGEETQKAKEIAQISSTCTVFAESEVISQLANGVEMPDLIAGICDSVASRTANLAKRIDIQPDVCMSGGVAQNGGVRRAIERHIGQEILFSEKAQLFGAIGAALYGFRHAGEAKERKG